MASTFEAAFLAWVTGQLNNPNVTTSWGLLPEGAPVQGKIDVVLFYAPGGERQAILDGVSTEQTRKIQFSIFSPDPQDVKDVAKSLHAIVDGAQGTLADSTPIYNIVPGMQDIDAYDNEEKVHQTVFDVDVHIGVDPSGMSSINEPLNPTTKDYVDAGDAATLAAAEAYTDTHGGAVSSVAGKTGAVTLVEGDIANLVTDLAAKAAKTYVDSQDAATLTTAEAYADTHGPVTSVATKTGAVTLVFSDIGGTAATGQLPLPTLTNIGAIKALAAVAHKFLTSIGTDGIPVAAQPAYSDLTGTPQLPITLSASASNWIRSYDALTGLFTKSQPAFSDISGTVAAAQLPTPTAALLGGVKSLAAVVHNFLTSIGTDGVPVAAQPAFTDISGTVAAAQLPTPTASLLGGVKSLAAVAHKFLTSIGTDGLPVAAQPALADLSDTPAANLVAASPDGSSGALSARALVAADIPSLDASKITTGVLAAARGGIAQILTAGQGGFFGIIENIAGSNTNPILGSAGNLLANNTVFGVQFVLKARYKVSKIVWQVSNPAGTAVAPTMDVGLYNADFSSLLLHTGATSVVTTALTTYSVTITPVTLDPGVYNFAYVGNATSGITNISYIAIAINPDLNLFFNTNGTRYWSKASGATAGVLPNSVVTPATRTTNSSYAPLVWFEP